MKKQFFNFTNWDNYKPLLYKALQITDGDVIEMGMGDGSTKLLHDYCQSKKRNLFSFDSNEDWTKKYKPLETKSHTISVIHEWDNVHTIHPNPSVVLIDHAPGERRHIDVEKYKDINGIIVIHDTEPEADHGYQMSKVFPLFKYVTHFKSDGAWASAVSNSHDVTKF